MSTDKQVKSKNKTAIIVALIGILGAIIRLFIPEQKPSPGITDTFTNHAHDHSTVINKNNGTIIINPPIKKDIICDSIKSVAMNVSLKIKEKIIKSQDENAIILLKIRGRSLEEISRYDCEEINLRQKSIHTIIEKSKTELENE